jgi:hypothetical protein
LIRLLKPSRKKARRPRRFIRGLGLSGEADPVCHRCLKNLFGTMTKKRFAAK